MYTNNIANMHILLMLIDKIHKVVSLCCVQYVITTLLLGIFTKPTVLFMQMNTFVQLVCSVAAFVIIIGVLCKSDKMQPNTGGDTDSETSETTASLYEKSTSADLDPEDNTGSDSQCILVYVCMFMFSLSAACSSTYVIALISCLQEGENTQCIFFNETHSMTFLLFIIVMFIQFYHTYTFFFVVFHMKNTNQYVKHGIKTPISLIMYVLMCYTLMYSYSVTYTDNQQTSSGGTEKCTQRQSNAADTAIYVAYGVMCVSFVIDSIVSNVLHEKHAKILEIIFYVVLAGMSVFIGLQQGKTLFQGLFLPLTIIYIVLFFVLSFFAVTGQVNTQYKSVQLKTQ